jgi:hypothetical protein
MGFQSAAGKLNLWTRTSAARRYGEGTSGGKRRRFTLGLHGLPLRWRFRLRYAEVVPASMAGGGGTGALGVGNVAACVKDSSSFLLRGLVLPGSGIGVPDSSRQNFACDSSIHYWSSWPWSWASCAD